MDAGTGLTILGSTIGGAKLIEKLLGPTADYVGDGLKNWAEKRIENTGRIFQKAARKLDQKIEGRGSVPPKVLKEVLDEGSYCDDELTAEYFGGVLASSRSGVSRDDRAATYMKLISELSTYQVRLHFIVYRAWRTLFVGTALRPTFSEDLEKMALFFPFSTLSPCMDFAANESDDEILRDSEAGLVRHKLLIAPHYGMTRHINEMNKIRGWRAVSEPGMCLWPTFYGIDLWLWAIGAGSVGRPAFLNRDASFPELPNVPEPANIVKLVTG